MVCLGAGWQLLLHKSSPSQVGANADTNLLLLLLLLPIWTQTPEQEGESSRTPSCSSGCLWLPPSFKHNLLFNRLALHHAPIQISGSILKQLYLSIWRTRAKQEVVEKGVRVERELRQSEPSLGSLGKLYAASTINTPHPTPSNSCSHDGWISQNLKKSLVDEREAAQASCSLITQR